MTASGLFLGVLYGAVGTAYCVYGRKQQAVVPFVSGAALILLPYVISNLTALVLVGLAVAGAPFVIHE